MTDTETKAYRQLWAAVALVCLSEYRTRIQAALAGRPRVYVPGNYAVRLGTLEQEMAAARTYLESTDFRRVCDLAGIEPKADAAMDYLVNATERFSLKAIEERAA